MPSCPCQSKLGRPAPVPAQAREGIAVSSSRMLVLAEGLAPAAGLTSVMAGEIPARAPAKRESPRAALLATHPWVAALSSAPQNPVQKEPHGSARTGSPYRGFHGRSAGRVSSFCLAPYTTSTPRCSRDLPTRRPTRYEDHSLYPNHAIAGT